MAAIAEQAGVSTGLIYRYFSNKTQLMVEILNDAVSKEIVILNDIAKRPETAEANLHAAVTAFVRRALTGPQLAYAFMAEPVDPQVEAERILCKQRFANVFKDILNTGIANKEFEIEDVETAAACVVGAMGLMTASVIAPTTHAAAVSTSSMLNSFLSMPASKISLNTLAKRCLHKMRSASTCGSTGSAINAYANCGPVNARRTNAVTAACKLASAVSGRLAMSFKITISLLTASFKISTINWVLLEK